MVEHSEDFVVLSCDVVWKRRGIRQHVAGRHGMTVCGIPIGERWGAGLCATSTDRAYWCSKCFPDRFAVIEGRRFDLSGRSER